MNSRALTLFTIVASLVITAAPLQARIPSGHDDSPDSMAIDAVVVRPLCLVATVVGTGLFIASLPITLISGSTHKAARTLVGKPVELTFQRKLGNFSALD